MTEHVLQLNEVTKTFGSGRTEVQALKKTTLEVARGEVVAIIGPSGSGKSTLLTIAGGLQTPTDGEVRIAGERITDLNEKRRSRVRLEHVGFILQSSNLVPFLTVSEQLRLLDKVKKNNMTAEERDGLLEELGIEELTKKYPGSLSGGERQRVAIAKALYSNPSLLLADEPTASLDSDRAFEVMGLLKSAAVKKNAATIVVTHDTRLMDYVDKVYKMVDGSLRLEERHEAERLPDGRTGFLEEADPDHA
ncbi:ABC transporter ATP-binding protein [Bhargavaea cecembensis]|uniref:ABC transporter ATP-binding protein n=1 Tax=Bhargavaea cecembensis TaxID=394098 RepID=UPI00058C06BD|nr:ABC transporter ATP-binding protein [Bhargavaea cecembensis]